MSRYVDLFIRSDASPDALADLIASRGTDLGVERDPDDGAPVVVAGTVRATLRSHRFSEDDDLVLSRYPWTLTAISEAPGHLGDAPETRLLRSVSSSLSSDHAVLLVLDLQYRKAASPTG